LRVALVSREVYPLAGGGIGEFVASAARLLSTIAEVTIITTSLYQDAYERLLAERDPRLPREGVRVAFVQEPSAEELGGWYDVMQCYGARVLERLRELYPDGGPDVIEFPDFLAEACVTLQAAQALDRFLEGTCVCVRIHTSAEITEVLNGYYHSELSRQVLYAMERYSLAHADRLIWPLGDVLGAYGRFYGAGALAPAIRIGYPYAGPAVSPEADEHYRVSSPLRLLFLGRLERRKGVGNLVAAARGLDRDDFRLTLVGGDTATGPLGVSMHELLRLAIADDERFELRGPADRVVVADAIREHDLVVVPSLWECGPYVGLEAFHLNRPVVGTPVGGLVELVEPGVSGWLADGTDRGALARALERVLDRAGDVERLVRSGELVARARALCDQREILDRYQELARLKPRQRRVRARAAGRLPLVSAIVPYYRSSRYVRETIESLLAQTYSSLEIVLVNDGSFEEEDWVVAELAARSQVVVVSQINSGLGAARNFGISQSRGRYVLPFDADDLAHPEFVERCVEVLERRPEVAYVTAWSRYMQEDGTPRPGPLGYQPLGNHPALVSQENVAGGAEALGRRRIFDLGFRYSEELTSSEDWHFYQELRRAGHFGAVIPERLLYYRVREDSMLRRIGMPRRARIEGEIEALVREHAMRWTPASAAADGLRAPPGEVSLANRARLP
jgi:glycosyltransferase involved in cell wall biosynthesis